MIELQIKISKFGSFYEDFSPSPLKDALFIISMDYFGVHLKYNISIQTWCNVCNCLKGNLLKIYIGKLPK